MNGIIRLELIRKNRIKMRFPSSRNVFPARTRYSPRLSKSRGSPGFLTRRGLSAGLQTGVRRSYLLAAQSVFCSRAGARSFNPYAATDRHERMVVMVRDVSRQRYSK